VSHDLAFLIGNQYGTFPPSIVVKIINVGSASYLVMCLLLRWRWFELNDVSKCPFLPGVKDLTSTIVDPSYRARMDKLLAYSRFYMVIEWTMKSLVFVAILTLGVMAAYLLGLGIQVVILWTVWFIVNVYASYESVICSIYTLIIWFIVKTHLDHQVNVMIDRLETLITTPMTNRAEDSAITIHRLDAYYRRLVKSVVQFDKQFSRKVISLYRFGMTFFNAFLLFGVYQLEYKILAYGVTITIISQMVISYAFLYTMSTLSNKRIELYKLVNSYYVKHARILRSSPIGQKLAIRRMVKNLGCQRRPLVCLTNSSGEELTSMEYVEFVLESISIFFLGVDLYRSSYRGGG
jgi:hypothetical protein